MNSLVPTTARTKVCRGCRAPKLLDDFNVDRRTPDQRAGECRDCVRRREAVRDMIPREHRPSPVRDNQYRAMFEAQHGVCAACREPEHFPDPETGDTAKLQLYFRVIDGRPIRGLVCQSCLGILHDVQHSVRRVAAILTFLSTGIAQGPLRVAHVHVEQ